MKVALLLVFAGIAVGLARGGCLRNLARMRIRLPVLVVAALALQVAAEILVNRGPHGSNSWGVGLLGGSYALVIAFIVLNRRLLGADLVAAGFVLNLAVVLANAGMPVWVRAAQGAGLERPALLEDSVKHRPMGPDTRLRILGDVLPVPVLGEVLSVGDLFIGAGLLVLVEHGTRSARRQAPSGPRSAPPRGHPSQPPAEARRIVTGSRKTGYSSPREKPPST